MASVDPKLINFTLGASSQLCINDDEDDDDGEERTPLCMNRKSATEAAPTAPVENSDK